MADTAKYAPINGGTLITDFKAHFSLLKTKRTVAFAYVSVFFFIAFTIFLAFSPSSNSSSPWFTDIFTTSFSSNDSDSNSNFSNESYRSHFSSIFSYFFPNSSTQVHDSSSSLSRSPENRTELLNFNKEPTVADNHTQNTQINDKVASFEPNQSTLLAPSPETIEGSSNLKNQTQTEDLHDKVASFRPNQSTILAPSPETNEGSSILKNQSQTEDLHDKVASVKPNQSTLLAPSPETNEGSSILKKLNQTEELHSKDEAMEAKQSSIGVTEMNQTVNSSPGEQIVPGDGDINIAQKGVMKNATFSSTQQRNNVTGAVVSAKQGKQNLEDLVKSMMDCDLYDGNWVKDDSYPLYKPGSCPLIDEQFNCFQNGRPDHDYYKLKWKPKGCALPRLNATHMLELLRGKRLAFVGDSLNRNMWESLICILRNSVKDQRKVYEESGRHHFRGEASYAFIFEEYKCKVEFFVSPFLVREWEVSDRKGTKKETLRLDLIGSIADRYKNADFIIFNTGHWWTHEKTSKGKDYYQEGSHVYSELNVLEAFRKALMTWGRWVDANINPRKTHVMFRGYSETHFSGGQWNSGGQCDHETEPIKNGTYLVPYSSKMLVFQEVAREMKTPVSFLNITRSTDYRKDGHPSIYRKQNLTDVERRSPLRFQDCSHWCLPGVPDSWNELLYAELLVKQMQKHR